MARRLRARTTICRTASAMKAAARWSRSAPPSPRSSRATRSCCRGSRAPAIEAGGAVYKWDGKTVNAGGVTTFQRHAVVSENRLTLLPPSLDDAGSDPARLRGADRHGRGVQRRSSVGAGETVAVFGTGGIGLNALMGAAFAGAMPIIGIDPSADTACPGAASTASHTSSIPLRAMSSAAIREICPRRRRCRDRGNGSARCNGDGIATPRGSKAAARWSLAMRSMAAP